MHVFFFNDTATTEIYTLSLHDALPISSPVVRSGSGTSDPSGRLTLTTGFPSDTSTTSGLSGRSRPGLVRGGTAHLRSEEHTSELQSPDHLVCRLLLEKKKSIHSVISII